MLFANRLQKLSQQYDNIVPSALVRNQFEEDKKLELEYWKSKHNKSNDQIERDKIGLYIRSVAALKLKKV